MEATELHHLCGIDNIKLPPRRMHWQKVILRFIGAECYVLGTKRCELSLTTRDGGFGLTFRDKVEIPAARLLGKRIDQGKLYDVRIEFPDASTVPDLSLASLCEGVYPRVLRNGEVIRIG